MKDTVACARCGALNDAEFGRCIRCGHDLAGATPAARATRRVPAPRRPLQGGEGERVFDRYPAEALPVARLLVFLNMAVYVLQTTTAMRFVSAFEAMLGGTPLSALAYGAFRPASTTMLSHEPWRLLAACFVHFDLIHLGMNMMALLALARSAEPLVGSVRCLIAYVASGIGGFLLCVPWMIFTRSLAMTAGASGAVFGLLGLATGVLVRQRDPQWRSWAFRSVVLLVVASFLPGINNAAHLGGMVTGFVCGLAFGNGAPQPSRPWQRWLAIACIAISIGAVVASRLSPYTRLELEHGRSLPWS